MYNENHPTQEPLKLEWTAVVSEAEEDEIDNKLNEYESDISTDDRADAEAGK